jgi:ferredoxin
MPNYKNFKKVFINPEKGDLEILYNGNTRTITLPDGKKIISEYRNEKERVVSFPTGKKYLVIKAPKEFSVIDMETGATISCPYGMPCNPPQSENQYLKICPWCRNCEACIYACPNGALGVDTDGFVVFLEGCDGCAECVTVCPHEAFQWKL